MTTRKPKNKFTLASLAPRAHKFELVHPAHGNVGATISMVGPDSQQFIKHSAAVAKTNGALDFESLTAEDLLKHTAEIYVPLITEWDEDFFGECSNKNKLEVLSNVENQWILKQIEGVFTDKQVFFAK